MNFRALSGPFLLLCTCGGRVDSSTPPSPPETPDAAAGCLVDGVAYANGAGMSEGCNSCGCIDGTWSCTTLDCPPAVQDSGAPETLPQDAAPAGCLFDGVTHANGATWKLDCNWCSCENALASCTIAECPPPLMDSGTPSDDAGGRPDANDPRCQILASNYDQSCTFDSDCTPVAEGNACIGGCHCPAGAAINRSSLAQFQNDWSRLAAPSAGFCGCPASFPGCCVQGKCQATSACGMHRPDASTMPPDSGPPIPPLTMDVECWSPAAQDTGAEPSQIFDGPCSLVGTWNYYASGGAQGALSFDTYGNWVGALGADPNLCGRRDFYGTYTLSLGQLNFVTIHDLGLCSAHPDWNMIKIPSFDVTCAKVTLRGYIDNCTGARPEFNYDLMLTKR